MVGGPGLYTWLLPYAQLGELLGSFAGPVAIGCGAGGAWMQDSSDFHAGEVRLLFQRLGFGKAADSDEPLWLQGGDYSAEVCIAGGLQG